MIMIPQLRKIYREKIVPELQKAGLGKNVYELPRLEKVVVHVGYGKHAKEQPYIDHVSQTLALITGQRAVHHKAKKSISNFKSREGMPIGASVTLRGDRMYEFVYKLIHLTLPRVRDFRGLSPKAFDHHGNYTIGIKEHIAFPEIQAEAIDKIHGLELTIATTAKSPAEGMSLLSALGFPFKKK